MNNRILLIDDDVIVRQTITDVLTEAGYDVTTASDGVVGMKIFRSRHPDLVITDIIMPEKEGIETLLEIHKENPNAKVIAISGGGRKSNTSILETARAMGANEILAKPFNLKELLTVVRRCLPLDRRPADRPAS